MTNEQNPVVERKERLQPVEVGVRGSELYVVGDLDPQTKIIKNAKIEHRSGSMVTVGPDVSHKKTDLETVWSVESESDFWQLHLDDLDGSTCESVDVRRSDGTQWNYTLTTGEGPSYPSTNLEFSRAQGYLMPILKPNQNGIEMQGKRLIVVEPKSAADYIGTVAPGFIWNEINGIEIVVQDVKNHTPNLEPFPTIRAVRGSVANPDFDKVIPTDGVGIKVPLHEVDLDPDLIASAEPGMKLRVKNWGIVYKPEAELPKGQRAVPLNEYLNTSADGVGLAGLFELFVAEFADHLSTHEPWMNNKTASYPVDLNESYGKPINVGLVKCENTWRVIYEDNPKGKFDRNGNPIQAFVGRDFDSSKVAQEPVQVHTLKPINKNNAREVGTKGSNGIHPVNVYVYEATETTKSLNTQTLCDFAKSGDGPAQMALMEWMGHTYGEVFNQVERKKYTSSTNSGTIVFEA